MARYLFLVVLVALIAALAGCGGSRGVSTTVTNTPPPAGTSRMMQPGDDLRYEVTGTHFDSWQSWPVTGTYTETVLGDGIAPPVSSITSEAGPYTAPTDVVGSGTVRIDVLSGTSQTVTLAAPADTLQDLRDLINGLGVALQATITNVGSTASPDLRLVIESTTPIVVGSRITAIDAGALTGGVAPGFVFPRANIIKQQIDLSTFKTETKWDAENSTWTAEKVDGVYTNFEEKINVSERYYVSQNADSSIWTWGGVTGSGMYGATPRTGVDYWISEPSTGSYQLLGVPLEVGTRWDANVVQSDGTTLTPAFVVSTYEVINVPAGEFRAHRITGSGRIAGMRGDIVMWWSPDIGAPVQFTVTTTDYIPNVDGPPSEGGAGYQARTLILTFKLVSKSRSG